MRQPAGPAIGLLLGLALAAPAAAAAPVNGVNLEAAFAGSPWIDAPGSGYRKGARQVGMTFGGAFGTRALGARRNHDFAFVTLSHARVLSGLKAPDSWNAGNWELLLDAVMGRQTHPSEATFVGFVPAFRYSFATGSRWVPYLEVGLGLTYNEIRDGDLSSDLELLAFWGGGARVYLSDVQAVTFGYRWMHLSNLGLTKPNLGVDGHGLHVGWVRSF